MEKTAFEAKYYVDRHGSSCLKWDALGKNYGDPDLIALWVADMDFRVPDSVTEALRAAVDNGAYGYYDIPDSYYEAFIGWEKEQHGYTVQKDWLLHTPGVVAGIYGFVNAMSEPGDACMILSPCYYPFMGAVRDNGRKLVCCMLQEHDGVYTVDFADFERKIEENDVKIFILCSPHNPVGRIWKREELQRMLEICRRHHVFVISDEIHQDIAMPGHTQIPTATVGDYSDMLVTLTAPSKTFNLAGCQHSIAIVPDKSIRARFEKIRGMMRIGNGNSFGYVAAEAAYAHGAQWLQGAVETIWRNYCYLRDTLNRELPGAVVSPLEGTYVAWVDLKMEVRGDLKTMVQRKARMAVSFGQGFYPAENGDCHIRINLATSGDNVETAVQNLIRAAKED